MLLEAGPGQRRLFVSAIFGLWTLILECTHVVGLLFSDCKRFWVPVDEKICSDHLWSKAPQTHTDSKTRKDRPGQHWPRVPLQQPRQSLHAQIDRSPQTYCSCHASSMHGFCGSVHGHGTSILLPSRLWASSAHKHTLYHGSILLPYESDIRRQ